VSQFGRLERKSVTLYTLRKVPNVLFFSERYRRGTDTHLGVVETENLVVTAGSTSGLHLVSTILMEPGAVVFVEDPTYFIALEIFAKDLCFRQGWQ
jgi:histidinol-phosphate/aromatic aminotransferase/cobyric acid decarboxylase-like protein